MGTLQTHFAPGAPTTAGLGNLIKDLKLDFAWSWRDFENPVLMTVGGVPVPVRVEADCPFLEASAKSRKLGSHCYPSDVAKGCTLNVDSSVVEDGDHASRQELCVDRCSFGSHNYVTDSSHQDECIQFNGTFCPPHDVGRTACSAQVMEDGDCARTSRTLAKYHFQVSW